MGFAIGAPGEREPPTMTPDRDSQAPISSGGFQHPVGLFATAAEYFLDAAQRSVLFWDIMRQRSNQYRAHLAKTAPHVLEYEVELVADGGKLERPVHYALARVVS